MLQDEIGTEYAVDVIRSAYEFHCARDINMYFSINLFFHAAGRNTYRKSLKRSPKETETEKRARRSRQQRVS